MGLERLSLLIMDDVIDAHHRAADEAWRELHRRADILPLPAGPDGTSVASSLAHGAASLARRLSHRPAPATTALPGMAHATGEG